MDIDLDFDTDTDTDTCKDTHVGVDGGTANPDIPISKKNHT